MTYTTKTFRHLVDGNAGAQTCVPNYKREKYAPWSKHGRKLCAFCSVSFSLSPYLSLSLLQALHRTL